MLKRGVVGLLVIGLASLGSVAFGASKVTFSTDWSAACTQCQAPLVAGSVAYTVDRPGGSAIPFASTVRTFAVATGAPGWTYALGKVDASSIAAIGGGILYVTSTPHRSGRAKLTALDAATGSVLWSTVPLHAASIVTGVALTGSGVFVVSTQTAGQYMIVTRYDTTGARVWSRRQHRGAGDFAVSGGNVYVFSSLITPPDTQQDFLTVYRESNGAASVEWTGTGLASGPPHDVSVANGLVYAVEYTPGEGSGFGTIAIDPTTGDAAWNATSPATSLAVGSNVAVSGDFQDGTSVTGLDALTGDVVWGPIGGTGANPELAGRAFYTSTGDTVYAHSTATGEVRGSFVSEGQTFFDVSAAAGHVYAAGSTVLVSLTQHSYERTTPTSPRAAT